MAISENHDYLDIGTPPRKSQARAPGSLLGTLVALGAGIACAGGIYGLVSGALLKHISTAAPASAGPTASGDDVAKRQITAFVERFLPAYYNFSYMVYDASVAKAETMMTPSFQAAYNQRAEDLDFKRKLIALRVGTNGIKLLPGGMAFSIEGERTYVRLAGTMTYTLGINGASGEFPLTLLMAIEKSDAGFLVDNVERLR